ncbi:MAG TPA: peptide-binding protein, partial [Campylobacterales bacterium]|nr:peptide-binding protein [Campylobacterales bacterium]
MGDNQLKLNQVSTQQMLGLMLLAYAFSFLMRMIWVWQFQDTEAFYWNDQLMINTNDGYFFASGVQKTLEGLHASNPRVFGWLDYGVIFFTTLLVKFTPMSLETAILYMPAIVSSLVVIPIILIARLYGQTLWGFFAALLGSIAWSYYNRTMTGYYDTDMFSAMAPMVILFFLMKSTLDFNLRSALYAALAIVIYPFLYDQGQSIVYAMGMIYALYMILYHRHEKTTYASLILLFVALIPYKVFGIVLPYNYLVGLVLVTITYLLVNTIPSSTKSLMMATAVIFGLFLIFGNVFSLIFAKISNYVATGTAEEGLHFYSVTQTVREAGKIPFDTFANRISGSQLGVVFAFIGYIILVIRHRAFILALPLMGIGAFALWGGLRFTVYAVPVAAMSAIFLFCFIGEQFLKRTLDKVALMAVATIAMLVPNILHIVEYKVPTVLNKTEVQDLAKLDALSKDEDYTLSWWDYGYPIWYYSGTNTLIDGGKHNHDNFIISKVLFSDSPEQVANLSRLAIETYVDSNYRIVADQLFTPQENPNKLLNDLKSADYQLPHKTRDVYLYMPYRMLRIFPTVSMFSNLDLMTGKKEREIAFYPSNIRQQVGSKLMMGNGIVFDVAKGEITIGSKTVKVNKFGVVEYRPEGKSLVQSQLKDISGQYSVVLLKSYGTLVVMDRETYNSAYVQMFMLDKHDEELFELVVSSPYSKIY